MFGRQPSVRPSQRQIQGHYEWGMVEKRCPECGLLRLYADFGFE